MPTSKLRDRLQRIVSSVFVNNAYLAARVAGVEPSTLHRILEGKVTEPRLGTVQHLADAFGVPLGWLLGELSSEAAQAPAEPLPESYWLILAFYRRQQRDTRAWIAGATAPTKEGAQLIRELQTFRLSPLGGFPAPAFREQLLAGRPTDPTNLALVRDCAHLETELLEYAVRILRQMGTRTRATGEPDERPRVQ